MLCEVNSADGSPHPTNERARLRSVLAKGADEVEAWLGYEQEYTLYQGADRLAFHLSDVFLQHKDLTTVVLAPMKFTDVTLLNTTLAPA